MGLLRPAIQDFIAEKPYVLLPGGLGTTLQLHGYDLRPESWSGEANLSALPIVERVQRLFGNTGTDIITTNTFRTHRHFIARVCETFKDTAVELACRWNDGFRPNFHNLADELTYRASKNAVDAAQAVQTAIEAAEHRPVYIGGSYGPLNDTHSHDSAIAQSLQDLRAGHLEHTQLLKSLGANLLVPETIPTLDEAVAMTEAASQVGLPYIASFVLNRDTGRLFDGTSLTDAVTTIQNNPGIVAITINCTPAPIIGPALVELLKCYAGPVGAYPNGFGSPHTDGARWNHDESDVSVCAFVDTVVGWSNIDPRVKIFGGCCGATPVYLKATRAALVRKFTSNLATRNA